MTRKLIPSAFILLALICSEAFAGVNAWTSSGPEGAVIPNFVVVSEPSEIYVATYGGGVFKSTDDGMTWKAINNGLTPRNISGIAVDVTNTAVLYAASNSGLYKTSDRGRSWVLTGQRNPVSAVVTDPSRAERLYAIANQSAYRSDDGGRSWRGPLAEVNEVTTVAVHPLSGAVYFISGGNTLQVSTDGFDSWQHYAIPRFSYFLALDPTAPSTMYVGGEQGIFKTVDGGIHWNPVNNGDLPYDGEMGMYLATALVVDPSASSNLFVAAGGIFKSTDGGRSFTPVPSHTAAFVSALSIRPSDGTLFAATWGDGIFKTTTTGDWTPLRGGLTAAGVNGLATNTACHLATLAATAGGLYQSVNDGASWELLQAGINVTFTAIDPNQSDIIYAGSSSQLLRSMDSGKTWSVIRDVSDFTDYLLSLVIDPLNPSTLYLGSGVAVSKSTDRGNTWMPVMTGLPSNVAAFSPLTRDVSGAIYAGTWGQGVFKSTDGGSNWTKIGAGLPSKATFRFLTADPYNGSLYTSAESDLFKSIDGGRHWAPLSLSGYRVSDLVIDPRNNFLYAGTEEGVLRSTDGGETWTEMNDGLTNQYVTSLVLQPCANMLYAGTFGGGVFSFTFASLSGFGLEKLPDDQTRLPRLLAEMAAQRSTHGATERSDKGFLITAAASTAGANGTFFHSDITLVNRSSHEQPVVVAWLSAGDSTVTPTFKMVLPAGKTLNGWLAFPPTTITDFVSNLGLSGLGALLFLAVDGDGHIAGADASIGGFSRIWSPASDTNGTVSQSLASVDPLALDYEPHGMAIGLRHDQGFRTNFGIVNLDSTPRRFDCRIVGEFATSEVTVMVGGLSLKQVAVPSTTYGALAIEIWAEHSEDGIDALHFPWAAYGTSVDNATGDGWAAQAGAVR